MVGSLSGDNSRKISFVVFGERFDLIYSSIIFILMMDFLVFFNIYSDDKKGIYMVIFVLIFFVLKYNNFIFKKFILY